MSFNNSNVDKYYINIPYTTNSVSYFDDTGLTDEWQREVYEYAKSIVVANSYKDIVDFGCGSGYKLIKYFDNFNTVGIDLPNTVSYLTKKYPNKTWQDSLKAVHCDIFIASDVIEHLEDPDMLIDFIKTCKPKEIIISTVDRNLVASGAPYCYGPPANPSHVREWTFNEFYSYISSAFNILEHKIVNAIQATQMIHARLKNE